MNNAREEYGEEWAKTLYIEVAECRRCGQARTRLSVAEDVRSGWSYCESMMEFLLGRPLSDEDRRSTLRKIVLN